MWHKLRITFLCIIILLIFSSYCLADDTSLGRTPDGVYPINNNDIEMVDELVNIYIEEGKVECTFTFKNTGEKSTVLMGFPATLDETYIEYLPGEIEDSIISDFTALYGENELSVKLENEVKVDLSDSSKQRWYDKWYTFEVPFKAGETKVIKNTYNFKAPVCAVGPGLIRTGYVLDTGAAWKGNIGHAKVVFHFGDILFTRIDSFYPFDISALTLEKDKLTFEKSNFEPDFNLNLEYWMDSGNLEENEPFYEYLNYDRHMRMNRFYELTESGNKDKAFKEAVIRGNHIDILYLLDEISRPMYESTSPEIGELLINHERTFDISVTDLAGDLKHVKYEIYSLEKPDIILYDEEKSIEQNSIDGFGLKNTIYSRNYKAEAHIKLKISAVDYKNNTMNYESDIHFDGDSNGVQKVSKELEDNDERNIEKNQQKSKLGLILYTLIGILLIICVIQQIRIHRLKKLACNNVMF